MPIIPHFRCVSAVMTVTLAIAAPGSWAHAAENDPTLAAIQAQNQRNRQQEIERLKTQLQATGDPMWLGSLRALKVSFDDIWPLCQTLLDGPDQRLAEGVVQHLATFGPTAAACLPRVLALYDRATPHARIKETSLTALGQIGPDDPGVIQRLVQALGSRQPASLQLAAALGLEHGGPPARVALSRLEALRAQGNAELAYHCQLAIEAISATAALPAERLRMVGADIFLGAEALGAWAAIQMRAMPAVEARALLIDLLQKDIPTYLCALTIERLAALAPSENTAAAVLLRVAESTDEMLTFRAEMALLHQFVSIDLAARDTFVRCLPSASDRVRQAALKAMRGYGAANAAIIPDLAAFLARCDGSVSHRVIGYALDVVRAAGLGGNAVVKTDAIAPVLTAMLSETALVYRGREAADVHLLRPYLLLTLTECGITASTLPSVLDLLANSSEVRSIAVAARAAAKLGPAAGTLVAFLQRPLADDFPDQDVDLTDYDRFHAPPDHQVGDPPLTTARLEAIRALIAIGPAAKPALPLLRRRMTDDPRNYSDSNLPAHMAEAARAVELLSR